MKCKIPYINAVNTSSQLATAGGYLSFNQVVAEGTCIGFLPGSTTFTLPRQGVYEISFDADATGTTATTLAVSISSNGTTIPGATATSTMTTGDTTHFHVQGVVTIRKSCECIDNTTNIQVVTSAVGTVENANIIIHKIA